MVHPHPIFQTGLDWLSTHNHLRMIKLCLYNSFHNEDILAVNVIPALLHYCLAWLYPPFPCLARKTRPALFLPFIHSWCTDPPLPCATILGSLGHTQVLVTWTDHDLSITHTHTHPQLQQMLQATFLVAWTQPTQPAHFVWAWYRSLPPNTQSHGPCPCPNQARSSPKPAANNLHAFGCNAMQKIFVFLEQVPNAHKQIEAAKYEWTLMWGRTHVYRRVHVCVCYCMCVCARQYICNNEVNHDREGEHP